MYFEVSIGKLSKVQLNNLLKGKNVRVKSGAAHTINLTEAQVKKFYKNTSKGKAFTVKLNQEQIAKQGGGILGDLVGLVYPTAGMVAKAVGLGMKKTQGKGILSDIVGLINPNAGMIAKSVGLGMKKKHGKGFFTDLAKDAAINLAKNVGKFAVDKGTDFAKDKASEYLKSKIEGLGMKKRKATSAQLAALAKGRAIRDANRYGGALYVA